MVAALLKEKQDEIDHKEFCVKDLNTNAQQTAVKEDEKQDVLARIADLEKTIEDLTEAIKTLKADIAELQKQLKMAGEDRERENNEFQEAVADQRATQKLLQAALAVLSDFYNKKAKAALIQDEPFNPPPGFSEYKKSAQSSPVMKLLEEIIADPKNMEDESIRAEENAQKAYEDF